jgi:hypothetical protein
VPPGHLASEHIAKRAAQTYNGATRFSSPQSSLWGTRELHAAADDIDAANGLLGLAATT